MPRPARRLSRFATSEWGQGYSQMLQAYGLAPSEFGDLTPQDRAFIQAAWNEQQRRNDDTNIPTQLS